MPTPNPGPVVFSWPDTPPRGSFWLTNGWQPITSPVGDDYGWYGRKYCHARRAFLTSYHFSERNGFKEKMKRSVKGLNKAAMDVVFEVRREVSKRRFGVRVYRFTIAWPSLFMVRCFVPWSYKDQQYLDP
ncbi:hypothetical protein Acr_08g0011840 [Actinidia rufa]|uniref:Uncharacterized protein n=1 Tax=Actinidia rufa TaxID=165716 RepID=A0A7J0F263_9ERIC|nr:hypothetical protein Acr_08g0011840 [Actinidia rufa]